MMSTSVATICYILHTTERKKKKKRKHLQVKRSCQDPLSGALLYVTPRKTEKGMSQAEL